MDDTERLARFDQFAADLRAELVDTAKQLEQLRAEGKVKSATYQQLFSNKLLLQRVDERLQDLGL